MSKKGLTIQLIKASMNREEVVIPDSVKIVGVASITGGKIEIPNSCTKIATNAFAGCQNLETIKINKKENSISGAPWGAVKGLKVVKWGD